MRRECLSLFDGMPAQQLMVGFFVVVVMDSMDDSSSLQQLAV